MKSKMRIIVWMSAIAPVLASADVVVGADEDVEIAVGKGDTLAIDGNLRVADEAAGISKTGGGTLSVPLGSVWARSGFDVNVREGSLSVSAEGSIPALDPENPPAAMRNAAFWLEASTNAAVWSKDETRIETWYDVREANTDGVWGSDYYRAVALPAKNADNVVDAITNFPVLQVRSTVSGERPMMYFHGVNSGSFMRYAKNNGTFDSIHNVCHAFAVIDVDLAYGFLFAAWNTAVFMHPSLINTVALNASYANLTACGTALPNGRFYLDGKLSSPGLVVETNRIQVVEIACGEISGSIGALFTDRNMKGRYGGDWVGEIVLFTNRLTEAERLDVSEYLCRKWVGEPSAQNVRVNLASDTEVNLAKAETANVSVSGTGRINLEGGGAYVGQCVNSFAGSIRVDEDSGATVFGLSEYPVSVKPGDKITTSRNGDFNDFSVSTAVDASKAQLGIATQTGTVPLRVGSLAGVKEFSAGTERLTLSPVGAIDNVIHTNVWATIAGGNGGFEDFLPSSDHLIKRHSASSGGPIEAHGWRLEARDVPRPDGNGSAAGYIYIANSQIIIDNAPSKDAWLFGLDSSNLLVYDKTKFYPSEGVVVAIVKVGGKISADVEVPEAGDYELTYNATGRLKYEIPAVTISIVNETATPVQTNRIARYLQKPSEGWRKHRFLVRNLEKGTYRLVVDAEGQRPDADCCAIFDDFRMKLVTAPNDRTIRVSPPNGSFEVADCPFDMRYTYSPSNTVQNWTLVQGDCGSITVPTNCEVCFSSRWHGNEIGRWFNFRARYGETQLLLRESKGYVQSDAFTLPEGTWRLHVLGSRWGFGGPAYEWCGHNIDLRPRVAASVVVNNNEVQLGSTAEFTKNDFAMEEYSLPNTFSVVEGDSVVLKLRQGTSTSGVKSATAILDEVWFERVDCVKDGGNIISGWMFNDASLWTTNHNKVGENTMSYASIYSAVNNYNYGFSSCGDTWALLLVQVGIASQQVTFPEAGLYKVSFWTRSRYSTDRTTGQVLAYFGGNQVRAWIADNAGVTQEIYRTHSVYSTNFFEHVAMFNVDTPGTYTFGLQGCNSFPDHVTTRSTEIGQKDSNVFVDCVSIKKASDSDMPELDEELKLNLAATSRLRLDFAGTATIKQLRLGGARVSGLIDASHPSGLVSGPGCLYIQPRGTVVTFR